MLDSYIKFIRAHHTILLILAGFGNTLFLGNLWINRSYDTALAKNSATQQVLQVQATKNVQLEQDAAARDKQYQDLLAQVTKANQSLVAAIAARNQTVVGQQSTDKTLPLSDLATRQQTLVGLSTGISSTESGLAETPAAAIVVTQKLETLPVLEQNVTDLQTLAGNKDKQITSITTVVGGLNDQVNGLKTQVADGQTACKAEVSLEVAKARKSKVGWFKAGAVVGFIAGLIVGHHV